MSCEALLVNCMDPRLQGSNAEKIALAAGFAPGTWEQLSYAGPPLLFTNPHKADHVTTFGWLVDEVSEKVHQIHTVVFVGHSDCGGFKLKHGSMDPVEEKATIIKSLRATEKQLRQLKPELKSVMVFVDIPHDQSNGSLPKITCEVVK